MPRFMDPFLRLIRKATFAYKGLFGVMSLQQYLFVNIGSPLAQLICFTLAAHYSQPDYDLSYWVIGNVLVLTYFNAIFGVGAQLSSEKSQGTLKLLVASPSSRIGIFLPRAILHIFDGLISMSIGFGVGMLIFGFRMPVEQLPAFLLVLLAASFSAMAFGLLIACFGMVTRDLNLLLNLASMTLLGMTGANFPVSQLPVFLQKLSDCMPLTRSIELCRLLQKGTPLSVHYNMLVGELVVGASFMIVATVLFQVMEKRAIKEGILELF